MEEGKRVSPSVPYGYFRNPKNKQELLCRQREFKGRKTHLQACNRRIWSNTDSRYTN